MATQSSAYGQRTLSDYLVLGANALYALFGLAFLVGLYYDWQMTGQIAIPFLVIAHEPVPNSGLFVLGFIFLVAGYVVSTIAGYVESYRAEEVDETQEWTVDVGSNN